MNASNDPVGNIHDTHTRLFNAGYGQLSAQQLLDDPTSAPLRQLQVAHMGPDIDTARMATGEDLDG